MILEDTLEDILAAPKRGRRSEKDSASPGGKTEDGAQKKGLSDRRGARVPAMGSWPSDHCSPRSTPRSRADLEAAS